MQLRPGFARLLPLMALTGLAGATIAFLASPRPVQAPSDTRMIEVHTDLAPPVFTKIDADCSSFRWA